jgi:hypothetical protein
MEPVDTDLLDDADTLQGEVNTTRATRKVLLVKIPNFLAAEWAKAVKDRFLGKVFITERDGKTEV